VFFDSDDILPAPRVSWTHQIESKEEKGGSFLGRGRGGEERRGRDGGRGPVRRTAIGSGGGGGAETGGGGQWGIETKSMGLQWGLQRWFLRRKAVLMVQIQIFFFFLFFIFDLAASLL